MKTDIGCSGFYYSDWKGKFYPADLAKNKWLEYYAGQFNTVEINNSFYRMPSVKILQGWKDKTPEGFRFTMKANRYFTHVKKLKADDDFRRMLDTFQETVLHLDHKLAGVLWQLPGNLHQHTDALYSVCKLLDKSIRHVFEFRHDSWFNEETYEVLAQQDVSICMLSAPDNLPEEVRATNRTAYLRFHGKSSWYDYNYSHAELNDWKERLAKLKQIDQLFVYFNNDYNANAANNALYLNSLF